MLRSMIFAGLFYGGSLLFVLAALTAALISRRLLIAAARNWSRYHRLCARLILGVRIETLGPRTAEQVIYAIKHESFFEAIDLPALLDAPAIPFAKAELLRIPLWGWAAARYGVVPVERRAGAHALRDMAKAARAQRASGRSFVIFPEGTRVPPGTAPALQSGFAGLYKLLDLPVVPVAVNSGARYQSRPKRSGTITYLFGEPIPPGLSREVVERRVHEAINTLNQADAAQQDAPLA